MNEYQGALEYLQTKSRLSAYNKRINRDNLIKHKRQVYIKLLYRWLYCCRMESFRYVPKELTCNEILRLYVQELSEILNGKATDTDDLNRLKMRAFLCRCAVAKLESSRPEWKDEMKKLRRVIYPTVYTIVNRYDFADILDLLHLKIDCLKGEYSGS